VIRPRRHRTGLVLVLALLALLGLVALGGASGALAHDMGPGGRSAGPTANPVAGPTLTDLPAATQTPNPFPVAGQGFTPR
jgi:hypothetical protein